MQGEPMPRWSQEKQENNFIEKKRLYPKDPKKSYISKNMFGNKNLFLKDKKNFQPMMESNKSFNKNK